MNVFLLVLWGDSLTYTIAKALAFNGHQVQIWVADSARHNRVVWGTPQRIAAIPGVTVIQDGQSAPLDHAECLIVQGHPLLFQHQHLLHLLAPRAARLTAISAGDRSRHYRDALRLQYMEQHWYGRWFAKVHRIAYKDGFYTIDLHGLRRPRRVIGFDPHANFLNDEALYERIHAKDWEIDTIRPIRASFLGSRDPSERGRVLDSVEGYFVQQPHAMQQRQEEKRMLWHAYSDASPAARSPEQFLQALTDSDFTLAPPGFSLITHRPIEALLRGSIPVLHAKEIDLYDLGLAGGVNCIAVRRAGWPAAMQRIIQMSEGEIIRMRRNIRQELASKVAYPMLSRDICERLLGLNE